MKPGYMRQRPQEADRSLPMNKNVIFLDIDGVLQPGYCQRRFKNDLDALRLYLAEKYDVPEYEQYDKYDLGAIYYDWDQESVDNLKLLLNKTNAVIVLSSTWRRLKTIDTLKNYFRIHDLDSFLVDFTPVMDGASRSVEIETYLNHHPEIGNFLILDDVDFKFSDKFPNHFVNTGRENRFIDEYLNKSLEILTGSDSPIGRLEGVGKNEFGRRT